jgi:pyruvyl transferase EpsO
MAAFTEINTEFASARLLRGLTLLSRGRGVITDRLHAHILSLLLDKPHVLVDNSYGKNRTFYETWTSECEIAELAVSGSTVSEELIASLKPRLSLT